LQDRQKKSTIFLGYQKALLFDAYKTFGFVAVKNEVFHMFANQRFSGP
jgi:hypothetical protein